MTSTVKLDGFFPVSEVFLCVGGFHEITADVDNHVTDVGEIRVAYCTQAEVLEESGNYLIIIILQIIEF